MCAAPIAIIISKWVDREASGYGALELLKQYAADTRQSRGERRGRGGGQRPQHAAYEEIPRHNILFEEYYNDLKLVPENEQESFWEALRRELPNSFRFTGSKGYGQKPPGSSSGVILMTPDMRFEYASD